MDWFKGNFTGKPHIYWENRWFPADFPLNQSIDTCKTLQFDVQLIFPTGHHDLKIGYRCHPYFRSFHINQAAAIGDPPWKTCHETHLYGSQFSLLQGLRFLTPQGVKRLTVEKLEINISKTDCFHM